MQETVALREERANLGNSTEVGEDALALLAVPLAASAVVMTDPGRSPSLVGRTALARLNLKQREVWKGKGQNVAFLKPQGSSRVGRGGPDGGPVVFLCSITWILCLALRVHVDTLRLSFKTCREVDSYLGWLWRYCKVSNGNQLEAFILAVCMLGSIIRRALGIPRSLLMHLTCSSTRLHLAGTKMWLIVTSATGRAFCG